eukprot:15447586-Alexandrium_andersonii.AAC.1
MCGVTATQVTQRSDTCRTCPQRGAQQPLRLDCRLSRLGGSIGPYILGRLSMSQQQQLTPAVLKEFDEQQGE